MAVCITSALHQCHMLGKQKRIKGKNGFFILCRVTENRFRETRIRYVQSYLGTRPPLYSTKSVLDQKIRVENASDLEQIFGTRLAESTRTRSSALLGQRVSVREKGENP